MLNQTVNYDLLLGDDSRHVLILLLFFLLYFVKISGSLFSRNIERKTS